ncbi:MAG: hypothetical protein ACFFCS_27555 [Candidatus Hodarchaeota archaeon]
MRWTEARYIEVFPEYNRFCRVCKKPFNAKYLGNLRRTTCSEKCKIDLKNNASKYPLISR